MAVTISIATGDDAEELHAALAAPRAAALADRTRRRRSTRCEAMLAHDAITQFLARARRRLDRRRGHARRPSRSRPAIRCWVEDVIVDEASNNQGIGRLLLDAMVARAGGARRARPSTSPAAPAARPPTTSTARPASSSATRTSTGSRSGARRSGAGGWRPAPGSWPPRMTRALLDDARVPGMSMRRSRRVVSSGATATATTLSATAVSTVPADTTTSMLMSGMVVSIVDVMIQRLRSSPAPTPNAVPSSPMIRPSTVSRPEDPAHRQAEGEEGGPFPGALVRVDARRVVGDEQGEQEDEGLEHPEDPGELLQAVLHDLGGHRDGLHRGSRPAG